MSSSAMSCHLPTMKSTVTLTLHVLSMDCHSITLHYPVRVSAYTCTCIYVTVTLTLHVLSTDCHSYTLHYPVRVFTYVTVTLTLHILSMDCRSNTLPYPVRVSAYVHIFSLYSSMLEMICYDDACHLKRYATNCIRSTFTETNKQLSTLNYVVDRMHFRGHVDSWCKKKLWPRQIGLDEKCECMCMFRIPVCILFYCSIIHLLHISLGPGQHWNLWTNFFMAVSISKNHKTHE